MPIGYVPGLPKSKPPTEAPQWGTVTFEENVQSWNVTSLTMPTPADNEFYVVAGSQSSNAYHYIMGTSQHTTQTGEGLIHAHNGTNGWTTLRIDILKPRPGATWSTTVNTNFAGQYHAIEAARFSYTEGFQIRGYRSVYFARTTTGSQTLTPWTNKGQYPGGVCVAAASHEAGGSGLSGIDTASENAGWVDLGSSGLVSLAYYILSTTEIEDAPSVTFTTNNGGANCWVLASAYIR